jgi:hypothetical protein
MAKRKIEREISKMKQKNLSENEKEPKNCLAKKKYEAKTNGK